MKTSKKLIISIVIKSQSIGDRETRDELRLRRGLSLEDDDTDDTLIQPLASDLRSQMYDTLSSDNIEEIEPPPGFRVNIKY